MSEEKDYEEEESDEYRDEHKYVKGIVCQPCEWYR
jgi:hypothetical protein